MPGKPNKFQKSVMERQGEFVKALPAEQAQNKTPPPGGAPDVSGIISLEPGRTAKNKTFYLDEEVIEAVKATAKSQKVTDSKLVNAILQAVLVDGVKIEGKN